MVQQQLITNHYQYWLSHLGLLEYSRKNWNFDSCNNFKNCLNFWTNICPLLNNTFKAIIIRNKIVIISKQVGSKYGILLLENIIVFHLGFKFDLRLYVAVTSFDPLRIYLYKEGLGRFASEPYLKGGASLDNLCVHLTNYKINKLNPNFVR